MNNPEKTDMTDMTEHTNISSKLISDLEASRVNLMAILKTVTESDFLTGLPGESVVGEQQEDSIVTLLVRLAHQEEKNVRLSKEKIPNITEPPQAIHYLLGVRWDTNRTIKNNAISPKLEVIIQKIVERENGAAKKIASRPPTVRPVQIPIIDTN